MFHVCASVNLKKGGKDENLRSARSVKVEVEGRTVDSKDSQKRIWVETMSFSRDVLLLLKIELFAFLVLIVGWWMGIFRYAAFFFGSRLSRRHSHYYDSLVSPLPVCEACAMPHLLFGPLPRCKTSTKFPRVIALNLREQKHKRT
jgi:hypothetical protein